MPRSAVRLEKKSDDRSRHVTFNKRKVGLIKKAIELSVLCDCSVAVLVRHSDDQWIEYSSSTFDELLKSYAEATDVERFRNKDYKSLKPGKVSVPQDTKKNQRKRSRPAESTSSNKRAKLHEKQEDEEERDDEEDNENEGELPVVNAESEEEEEEEDEEEEKQKKPNKKRSSSGSASTAAAAAAAAAAALVASASGTAASSSSTSRAKHVLPRRSANPRLVAPLVAAKKPLSSSASSSSSSSSSLSSSSSSSSSASLSSTSSSSASSSLSSSSQETAVQPVLLSSQLSAMSSASASQSSSSSSLEVSAMPLLSATQASQSLSPSGVALQSAQLPSFPPQPLSASTFSQPHFVVLPSSSFVLHPPLSGQSATSGSQPHASQQTPYHFRSRVLTPVWSGNSPAPLQESDIVFATSSMPPDSQSQQAHGSVGSSTSAALDIGMVHFFDSSHLGSASSSSFSSSSATTASTPLDASSQNKTSLSERRQISFTIEIPEPPPSLAMIQLDGPNNNGQYSGGQVLSGRLKSWGYIPTPPLSLQRSQAELAVISHNLQGTPLPAGERLSGRRELNWPSGNQALASASAAFANYNYFSPALHFALAQPADQAEQSSIPTSLPSLPTSNLSSMPSLSPNSMHTHNFFSNPT